jgi:DNA-binding GntR family transcriptional regulator
MIEAIARRDAEAAETLMRRHFQRSRAVLEESLEAGE